MVSACEAGATTWRIIVGNWRVVAAAINELPLVAQDRGGKCTNRPDDYHETSTLP